MSFSRMLTAGSVVGVILSSPTLATAQAAIEQVFSQMEQGGATVAFSEKVEAGRAIEWRDLQITGPDGEVEVVTAWIKETDLGNGASEITFARSAEIAFFEDGAEIGRAELTSSDLEYRIEQQSDGFTHSYSADEVALTRLSGEVLTALNVAFLEMSGEYTVKNSNITSVAGGLDAGSMRISYEIADEDFASGVDYVIDTVGIAYGFDGPTQNIEEIESLDNLATNVSMTMQSMSGASNFGEGAQQADITFTSGAGATDFTLAEGRFDLVQASQDFNYVITLAGLGFPPFDVKMSSMVSNMGMPLSVSAGPSDGYLDMRMNDLEVSETLWSIFDPEAGIPRDPATLVIDVTSEVEWTEEPFEASAEAPPIQVNSATINQITLDVGGAKLNATGDAVFNNDGPFPMPVGAVNVMVDGALALMDNLVNIGVMTPDMAFPARTMLGVFAKPVGDDAFESLLEFGEDGSISANGQRIR